MSANAKISGSWKDVSDIQCKVSSTWIPIDAGFAKISGTWQQFYSAAAPQIEATGGTITDVGGFRYHTFTSSGTFEVTSGSGNVDYLTVAGGGGGGGHTKSTSTKSGGGGAGGVAYGTTMLSSGSYTITVGAGGTTRTTGNNSLFDGIVAKGGGWGAYRSSGDTQWSGTDRSGGSGGGGAYYASNEEGFATQPGTNANADDFGFNGGRGWAASSSSPYPGSGGGGASEKGEALNSGSRGGNGGEGLDYSTTFGTSFGESGYFAGGGGGGGETTSGQGGLGGGGNGGNGSSAGQDGTLNTGGGGGGSGSGINVGGSGGSGIVIIRYELGGTPPSGDATIYSVTDTHAFVSHNSSSVSRTMTLDSNTDREIWLVFLTIGGGNTLNTPTVTIGGNSMTSIASETFNDTSMFFFNYQDDGALGTSATITTDLDFGSIHSAYIVFTSEPTDTTIDSYGAEADGSTPTSGTLSTSSSGWSFYIATAQNATPANSIPNFGNEGFFDYGTGEELAYGFNSPEDDGTVSVQFANFGSAGDDNIMLALSRGAS